MAFTRRDFVKGGVAAFTWGFAAPAFLSDVAQAQGAASRNLVVLYLGGGNDSLNTVIPYGDAFYYSRRPTIAIPPGSVLQMAATSAPGLHPNLSGLRNIYPGPAGDHPTHRLPEPDRSHFSARTSGRPRACPRRRPGSRALPGTLPLPVESLTSANTNRECRGQ